MGEKMKIKKVEKSKAGQGLPAFLSKIGMKWVFHFKASCNLLSKGLRHFTRLWGRALHPEGTWHRQKRP